MSPEIARRVINYFSPGKSYLQILTNREIEILENTSKDTSYKDLAIKLDLSITTIRNHFQNIYKKLQVKTKAEAVEKFTLKNK